MKSTHTATTASHMTMRMGIKGRERREHRRHDLDGQGIGVERWDAHRNNSKPLGRLVDLSAGGVRIRARGAQVKPDQQIRVRLQLPAYAGISPFVAPSNAGLQPKGEWVGWMTVCRVQQLGEDQVELCGRLVDMDEMDRGMLGLYLSTQPLAA
jgi:hypothetical protein